MIKALLKKILKLSPIPLSKNHKYDILTKKIISSLSDTSNCLDVGCFKGEILDLMRSAAPKGQHFGIEPIPSQYAYLCDKYADISNCTIFNIAASNSKGVSNFNHVTSNPSYSGLKKRDYDKPNETDVSIQVKTDLLDNIIPINTPIDLIKIDVEGAEMQVLEGASNLILKNKPTVIFEHGMGASNHYGTTPASIFNFFEQFSMKIATLENYISKKKYLSKSQFIKQYENKINYYFVAFHDK